MHHGKMEDFVIHRGERRGPVKNSVESRMMELLRAIDSQIFLKKLTQLRYEFQNCDFDMEINACKLYYLQGDRDKTLVILEEIRRKLLNYGETMLLKRMLRNDQDMGDLGKLPQDVMRLIIE